jgi:hypothetical protein
MDKEMAALDKNAAWDLMEFLIGRKPIGNKWILKRS